MVDLTVSRSAVPRRPRAGAVRTVLASLALVLLAGGFAHAAPTANGWAAAALAGALVLDGLARLAGLLLARRGRAEARIGAVPSVILAFGPGSGLGAVLLGVALLVWPQGFPVLASALAGLIAMGAVARLAVARIVLGTQPDAEA